MKSVRMIDRGRVFVGRLCSLLLLFSMVLNSVSAEEVSNESYGEETKLSNFFADISSASLAYDIDIVANLNDRERAGQRFDNQRLGGFPDLPLGSFVSSEELESWEHEYLSGNIGGLVISLSHTNGLRAWLNTEDGQRVFVTFHSEDAGAAEKLQQVASAYNYEARIFIPTESSSEDVAEIGEYYATAALRLAVDSRVARRYRSEVSELEYLGEKVRKGSNSLFKADDYRGNRNLARNEPAVFLKETLGDEFTRSTIEEIVVPGGVALGETAELELALSKLVFLEGSLQLVDERNKYWSLPSLEAASQKALFDFSQRAQAIGSDAIVDIDALGRVKISSALRDTDVGYAIMHADTQPFKFVPYLSVNKSVIIDTAVDWYVDNEEGDNELAFESSFEVRFLSADNMRIAQTRAAIVYEFDSASGSSGMIGTWGRDADRLRDSSDYSGLGQSMIPIAKYSAWLALFQNIAEQSVPFLEGRYEFLKTDKRGRRTPSRY